MPLLDQVRVICRRLAPLGWAKLLARHGLRLDASTLHNSRKLAAELARPLNVDRSASGFEDFWPDGFRAIEPQRPSRSLLYHAFASPLVHPASDGKPQPRAYPTLHELDILENYIYSRERPSLSHLIRRANASKAKLVVGVFAYQYRIGARSPNGKFASTALSRTGISRVGTTDYAYDPIRRSFWPVVAEAPDRIAVMPARYAAYLAEARSPQADDAILGEQAGDEDRIFLFPVHKLFDGAECLKRASIKLTFSERHCSEKLRKFHSETGIAAVDGLDINRSPFVRDSEYEDDLVGLERIGSSVLVLPISHAKLTRIATQKNTKTHQTEIARFIVPRQYGDNRYAGSSFQFLDPKHAERRIAPEYINIRHRVLDATNPNDIEDLNQLPWKKFVDTVRRGGYEAAHFIDDSCEGCVVANVSGIEIGEASKAHLAAFSMVGAPDFFPLVDQADVTDWAQRVLGAGGEREHFAQGGPRPLSERRNCVNPNLLRPDLPSLSAFPVRDDDFARIENVTAVIGGKSLGGSEHQPIKDLRFIDPSTTFLPDSASGIFDPGWDVSFSGTDEADFLASYGLGSPFPEDVKLCAALNSFWPSAVPDATRTFGLFPPEWDATTSVPVMDRELGLHPRHPVVLRGEEKPTVGWDGEQGPFFERGFRIVNHANIEQSDYVSNAIAGKISLAPLANVGALEIFRRMNAMRDSIAVLPEEPRRVSSTNLFLVSAEPVDDWGKRIDRGDLRLQGQGFLFMFAVLEKKGSAARERGRWLKKVKRRYTCQIASSGICWKRESKAELFTFEARQR
ncbi:MAG: hypothetical protein JWQ49_23 [Edaphobacter sp.]|nr:hypothetical protein [Edaphobacter sp.]